MFTGQNESETLSINVTLAKYEYELHVECGSHHCRGTAVRTHANRDNLTETEIHSHNTMDVNVSEMLMRLRNSISTVFSTLTSNHNTYTYQQ